MPTDLEARVEAGGLWSRWQPWPAVEMETWLIPAPPWHLRLHHVRSDRSLWCAEGGFALDWAGDPAVKWSKLGPGLSYAGSPAGASGVRDILGQRAGQLIKTAPNTNLLAPRAVLPTLLAKYPAGEYFLACAVMALPEAGRWDPLWAACPVCPAWFEKLAETPA